MAKDGYDSIQQIRLTKDLQEKSNKVFKDMGLSFSEAVRMFLETTVERGRLPFNPSRGSEADKILSKRKRELIRAGYSEETLLKSIFGEKSGKDMYPDELRDWGRHYGFDLTKFSDTTLMELYDSGLFHNEAWFGDISFDGDESDMLPVVIEQMENIKINIQKAADSLKKNAINNYLNDNYAKDGE